MSKLKRYFEKGNVYFVAVVTYQRKPILINNSNIFEKAITRIKKKHNFEIIAFVVMPDHFHMIINPNEAKLSQIMHDIKLSFNAQFRKVNSRYRGKLWQSRYWDHIIRDQDDWGVKDKIDIDGDFGE